MCIFYVPNRLILASLRNETFSFLAFPGQKLLFRAVPASRSFSNIICNNDTSWLFSTHKPMCTAVQKRYFQTDRKEKKDLVKSKESPYAGLTAAQKVKEAGKDVSYLGVILVGVAITGVMIYVIGHELFSKESPSVIYGKALKLCRKNVEVEAAFGTPIKGYGEETRRRRRRHVSHLLYDVEGVPHMRMKFYLQGPYKKGTVQLEVKKVDGKYEYRYMFVELEGYPARTIIIEDNR